MDIKIRPTKHISEKLKYMVTIIIGFFILGLKFYSDEKVNRKHEKVCNYNKW